MHLSGPRDLQRSRASTTVEAMKIIGERGNHAVTGRTYVAGGCGSRSS